MHFFEKTNNDMAGIYISYESPALNETKKNYGISHLLEHMICDATHELDIVYDEYCIQTNAYTGKEEVVFHMTGLSEYVRQFSADYINRITSYKPQEAHFKKELPIVLQEYDDWGTEAYKNTFFNYFSTQHGYIYSVGTRSALEGLDFNEVVNFKNKYFSHPSKIIVIDKEDFDIHCPTTLCSTPKSIEPYKYINRDMEINPSSVGIVAGSMPIAEAQQDYYLRIVSKMLAYGLKSPLYQMLREENNLCYWVDCSEQNIVGSNVLIISTTADIEKYGQIKDNIFEVLSHPDKYLTKERFDVMMKNTAANIKIKNQNKYNFGYVSRYFDKDSISVIKNLDKINYNEMLSYYDQYLNPAKNTWVFKNQKELYD